MGEESLREAGEEKEAMGYPRGADREPGEIENKFCNIAQFFAIAKAHRGRNP